MAIARLSVKVGTAGKATPHAAYIAREGQYEKYLEKGERLEATEFGNMPDWAKHQPQAFWLAADAFERSNGTTYREMEIALPREMTSAQRIDLVREWVRQEVGDLHAYQWAIHVPKAADGGEQPHVHFMFSERRIDGIERDSEQYFKRYNSKATEKGGAKKGYGPQAGQTLSAAERKAELKALRDRWEVMTNQHLQKGGYEERIDMRSYASQGVDRDAEAKQLPSQWRDPAVKAQILEFRSARLELAQAGQEVSRRVPNLAQVIDLERERALKKRAIWNPAVKAIPATALDIPQPAVAVRSAWRPGDRAAKPLDAPNSPPVERIEVGHPPSDSQRIAGLSLEALKAEIAALAPVPVHRIPEVMVLDAQIAVLRDQESACMQEMRDAERQLTQWRDENPKRTKLHDRGLLKVDVLTRGAAYLETHHQELVSVRVQLHGLETRRGFARSDAQQEMTRQYKAIGPQLECLETALLERERLLEQIRKEAAERSEKPAQEAAEGASDSMSEASQVRARKRPSRAFEDGWQRWSQSDRDDHEPGMD